MSLISTAENQEYQKLSAENILSRISEEEIFRHYVGFDFNLKTCYISLLRENDVTPSLNFYYNRAGTLCYKDFGHSQGNCFSFVMNRFGISYKEALERINNDLNLGLGVIKTNTPPTRYYSFKKEFKKESSLLQFEVRKFTKADIDYWGSFGISVETLKLYKVYAVSKTWLNKKLFWLNSDSNPIYAYYFEGSKHCKIYRPFAKPYMDAQGKKITGKWMTNCDEFDIQGLEQLPESGDILINTKSMKDVMLFKEFGFNAVAPQGEGHYIPKSLQEHLWTRFKRIITVYDNDSAGVRASIRINEVMGSEYWNIPKKYEVKDPTDFYNKYGQAATKELLSTIL